MDYAAAETGPHDSGQPWAGRGRGWMDPAAAATAGLGDSLGSTMCRMELLADGPKSDPASLRRHCSATLGNGPKQQSNARDSELTCALSDLADSRAGNSCYCSADCC